MINEILSALSGIFILFPFIIMILILFIAKRMGKSPASVIGLAADLTTPFLFLAVFIITRTIFGVGGGFYITLIAIVTILLYAIYEKKNVKEFRIIRLLRKTWRLFFLMLTSAYFLLLLLGVIIKIVEYAK